MKPFLRQTIFFLQHAAAMNRFMSEAYQSSRPVAVVILAAGKGTRMRSESPKVLHPIGNAPMLHHAMRGAESLEPARIAVVVGHGAEKAAEAARTLRADVNAFSRLFFGVASASALAVTDAFEAPAALLAELDAALLLPEPRTG